MLANLSYRCQIPDDGVEHEVFHLHFHGDEELKNSLYTLRSLIEFDKTGEIKIKIDKLRERKKENYSEWVELQNQIKKFKKDHLFWMFSKDLRQKMAIFNEESNMLADTEDCIQLAISELENQRFYKTSELTPKFKRLLAELGFKRTSVTEDYSHLSEEIYESTCSDEQLKIKVQNKIAQLERSKKEKQTELSERYSQANIIESGEIFYRG